MSLGVLREEANILVVAEKGVPPVEMGVELNSREYDMKARDEVRTVDASHKAEMTRGPAAKGSSIGTIGKVGIYPIKE